MDEKKPYVKGDPLPDTGNLYRLVLISERDRQNKMIPAVRCFQLKAVDNNKLSCDYDKLTTPEQSLSRLGATYKFQKEEFKNYSLWEIYALEIDYVKTVQHVINVLYDPISFEPKQKGFPDNIAHSLIQFNDIPADDEPQILAELRDHAANNKVNIDSDEVNNLVNEYRRQWD